MKISFNKRLVNGPYGGGNQVMFLMANYFRARGIEVSYSLNNDTSVVILMDVRDGGCTFSIKDIKQFKVSHPSVMIIHRINENDAHRKNSYCLDKLIIDTNRSLADKTIFVSEWLKKYFHDVGMNTEDSIVIKNGSDRSLFYPNSFRRNIKEPLKIITHHFSNNLMKGYDVYKELDLFCYQNSHIAKFMFVGRSPEGYLRYCDKIEAKPYSLLPHLLQMNDIYVTASLNEPGGNHVVEGLSCGLIPIVKMGGGSCLEYTNGFNFVFETNQELFSYISCLYENYELYLAMKELASGYSYSSDDMCEQYYNIIKDF